MPLQTLCSPTFSHLIVSNFGEGPQIEDIADTILAYTHRNQLCMNTPEILHAKKNTTHHSDDGSVHSESIPNTIRRSNDEANNRSPFRWTTAENIRKHIHMHAYKTKTHAETKKPAIRTIVFCIMSVARHRYTALTGFCVSSSRPSPQPVQGHHHHYHHRRLARVVGSETFSGDSGADVKRLRDFLVWFGQTLGPNRTSANDTTTSQAHCFRQRRTNVAVVAVFENWNNGSGTKEHVHPLIRLYRCVPLSLSECRRGSRCICLYWTAKRTTFVCLSVCLGRCVCMSVSVGSPFHVLTMSLSPSFTLGVSFALFACGLSECVEKAASFLLIPNALYK